jgi:hypothetical protein
MARVIQASPLLARVGLLDNVKLYQEKIKKYWPELIGETFNTKQAFEEMLSEGDFGMAAIVDEATPIAYDDFTTPFSKRYYPLMRSIGFSVSKQAKYTDLYGIVAKPSKKLAMAMNKTKEQKVANIFINATSTTGQYAGPDGKALIATDHPTASGVWTNRPATDISFGALAAAQGIQELGLTKSHRGDPSPIVGPFMFVGPYNLMDQAHRVFESQLQAENNHNDKNVVGSMVKRIHINPYFTFTASWFLVDIEQNPLFMLNRIPLGTDEDYDMDTKVFKFSIEEEYEANYKDGRGVWGSWLS